jgi:uncharacterized cupin superfamily protein
VKVTNSLDAVELKPNPMDPFWIITGTPGTMLGTIDTSRDGLSFTAIWTCHPSEFDWHYHVDEFIFVLEGRAVLTYDGRTVEIAPGSVVHFSAGTVVHWIVKKKIRKVAVWRHAMPWPLGPLMILSSRAYWKLVGIARDLTRRIGSI